MDEANRFVYKDKLVNIYPVKTESQIKGECYSYMIVPHKGKGQFNLFKAENIPGLERRRYRELVNGRPVTLSDGRVVQSEECVS